MSVVKSKRKESKFEVLHHAYKLRKDITELLLFNFGYKPQKREPETEYQQQRRLGFESWYISKLQKINLILLYDSLFEKELKGVSIWKSIQVMVSRSKKRRKCKYIT